MSGRYEAPSGPLFGLDTRELDRRAKSESNRKREAGMACPACGAKTVVVDSRVREEGKIIRRRRSCPKCSERFSTNEIIEGSGPGVLADRRDRFAKAHAIAFARRMIETAIAQIAEEERKEA